MTAIEITPDVFHWEIHESYTLSPAKQLSATPVRNGITVISYSIVTYPLVFETVTLTWSDFYKSIDIIRGFFVIVWWVLDWEEPKMAKHVKINSKMILAIWFFVDILCFFGFIYYGLR